VFFAPIDVQDFSSHFDWSDSGGVAYKQLKGRLSGHLVLPQVVYKLGYWQPADPVVLLEISIDA
jgi:hypothetical protein